MVKRITALAFLAASVYTATAQEVVSGTAMVDSTHREYKYRVVTNMFRHNWFIGGGIGAQIYAGDHDKQMNLGDRFAPYANVYVGRWFTPSIGVRLGLNGGRAKGVSGWTEHSNSHPGENRYNYQGFIKDYRDVTTGGMYNANTGQNFVADQYHATNHSYPLYQTEMDYINVYGDVMLNFSNLFFGYNPERFYSFIPFLSVGFAHSLDRAPISNKYSHEISAGLGLNNQFKLSNRLNLNLELRATMLGDHFDQEDIGTRNGRRINTAGHYMEGAASISVGVTYNLGRTTWERPCEDFVGKQAIDPSLIDDLNRRIHDLTQTNNNLVDQLKGQDDLRSTDVRERILMHPILLRFVIDHYDLLDEHRVNLDFLAQVLVANPDIKYSVTGYADKGTGSVARNKILADKRSQVIYDELIKRGVSPDQLVRIHKGGVDNLYYNSPRVTRSVVLRMIERGGKPVAEQ